MSFAFLPSLPLPISLLVHSARPVLSFSSSSSQSHTATAALRFTHPHISRHLHRIQNHRPAHSIRLCSIKSLAWFGFYVHFFILGIGYI
ncbi:hypothetical protein C8R47DRAFT_1091354, partial [Mycena vitilis]